MNPSESRSLSTCEFMSGYSVIAIEHALTKNGRIVNLGWTDFISFLSLISYVASISSEKVKKGIERDSVIVFVIAFLIPVICFTLKHFTQVRNLLIPICNASERCNFVAMSARSCSFFIRWIRTFHLRLCFALFSVANVVNYVGLCDTAVFSCRGNIVDIDALLLCNVAHSGSRQWLIYIMIVNSSVLLTFFVLSCWGLSSTSLRWLLGCLFGSGHFYWFAIVELNSQNCMSDSANRVVFEVDLFDYATCSWRNLGDKFVSENFAQVFVLLADLAQQKFTSSTRYPTLTRISLIVASLVPSPKSGSETLINYPK